MKFNTVCLAFEDTFFSHPEYVIKNLSMPYIVENSLVPKKKRWKKKGKLMCSGTNSEVKTFPKIGLCSFLTTDIGIIWWSGSASKAASLSASAMEPRTFLVGYCFVPLLDQEFMETVPYKIILGEHEAMISDEAEGNAEGLELAASSSQPPCLSFSRRTQAPLCFI